ARARSRCDAGTASGVEIPVYGAAGVGVAERRLRLDAVLAGELGVAGAGERHDLYALESGLALAEQRVGLFGSAGCDAAPARAVDGVGGIAVAAVLALAANGRRDRDVR